MRKMANSTPNRKSSPAESVPSNRTGLSDIPERKETRDALYLFACHVEWRTKQSLVEYKELLAAMDDHDDYICTLAEELVTRTHRGLDTDADIEAL
jgi:hypothetical protein